MLQNIVRYCLLSYLMSLVQDERMILRKESQRFVSKTKVHFNFVVIITSMTLIIHRQTRKKTREKRKLTLGSFNWQKAKISEQSLPVKVGSPSLFILLLECVIIFLAIRLVNILEKESKWGTFHARFRSQSRSASDIGSTDLGQKC